MRFHRTSLRRQVIEALARAFEAHDTSLREHNRRVGEWAYRIALELGLSEGEAQLIRDAGYLCDIGKIPLSEEILNKPGPLTLEEEEQVRAHPRRGAGILGAVDLLQPLSILVLYHHERWDGSGYPLGLRGEEIPLGSRILAVCDAFDSLCSPRPYRPAYSVEEALSILQRESGRAYDPQVVAALERLVRLRNLTTTRL